MFTIILPVFIVVKNGSGLKTGRRGNDVILTQPLRQHIISEYADSLNLLRFTLALTMNGIYR